VRLVDPQRETKSISVETTFETNLSELAALEKNLWRTSEKLALRLKESDVAAGGIVLKLKTAQFRLLTRATRLSSPTVLPDRLFAAARALLVPETSGSAFRLIGIGAHPLLPRSEADRGDLEDRRTPRIAAAQAAMDSLRARFGATAIGRGRGFSINPPERE
jgi:DNA polymerase-4